MLPLPFLINLLISVALNLAGTFVQQIFGQDQKATSGVRGTLQTGGDVRPSFIIGRYATGGKLKYAGTWGTAGDVPNAYYSKLVEVSFLPIRGFSGWFVNGERVTLAPTQTGDMGYAVLEYREEGVDHLWIKPYLGAQTVADPLLRAQFGSDPDRPFTADMVGRGLGMFLVTALVNRELFSGLPEVMAEVDGITLDDPRGDGKNDNPIVAIYTLLKGLSYGGEWVYGPQGITDYNFRATNLETEADKCDVLVSGQPRFRMGMEIQLDDEPHAVIGELLKASEGRWTEVGGIYKFLVGAPAAPVKSFTDEDIVITAEQTYEPFPGLESLFNSMIATYPEPAEAWQTKEAPPRYRSDLEAEDDNRRLPFSTDYKAVPYALQVQRLMRAALEETRRFRRHTFTAPPEWWEYEVLDVAQWSSDRNGYDSKQFLITTMEDLPNANQFVGLQEIDPADYDWISDYELPYDVAPLIVARPAPQPMTGWNVAPYIYPDSAAQGRRIGIEVFYAAGLVDVRAIRVQVREDFGTNEVVFDGEVPYDPTDPAPSKAVTWAGIIPNEDYEVQGKYVPFSGRKTDWSAWLGVTTPDIRLGGDDLYPIDLAQLGTDITAWQQQLADSVREANEAIQRVNLFVAEGFARDQFQKQELRQQVVAQFDQNTASWQHAVGLVASANTLLGARVEQIQLVTLPAQVVALSALTAEVNTIGDEVEASAAAITALEGVVGYDEGQATFRMGIDYTPAAGWTSRIGFQARATSGDVWRTAGIYLESTSAEARIVLEADLLAITNGGVVAALFESGTTYINNARIRNLDATNITAAKIDAALILQNGTAITELIANNAVTIGTGATTAADINVQVQSSPEVTIQSLVVTPNGGFSKIRCSAFVIPASNGVNVVRFRLRKAGTEVATTTIYMNADAPGTVVLDHQDSSPGSASQTLTFTAQSVQPDGSLWGSGVPGTLNNVCRARTIDYINGKK